MAAYSYNQELQSIDKEIKQLDSQLRELRDKKRKLSEKRDQIVRILENRACSSKEVEDAWESSKFDWSPKLCTLLADQFKMTSFRPLQRSALNAVMSGEDVVLVMATVQDDVVESANQSNPQRCTRTRLLGDPGRIVRKVARFAGGGKSLIYQLGSLLRPGFTLVVSPLISLMEDQVIAATRFGIESARLSADTTKDEMAAIQNGMLGGALKLLFASPEKLAKSKRLVAKLEKAYQTGRLGLICIDEVHCCSQWGHDFRKDYAFLNILKKQFGKTPLLGLTATATERVLDDVKEMLGIPGALVFRAPFNRANLKYVVRRTPESSAALVKEVVEICKKYDGKSGIIYCFTRKDVEDMTKSLRSHGVRASTYHAYLEPRVRSQVHRAWLKGDVQVIVATIAFGMGIDKPDVRFVVHASLSKSIENYYQESGRAGRDSSEAECILFFKFGDIFRQSSMVCTEKTGTDNLYKMVSYCHFEVCRRKSFAEHFGEVWQSEWCDATPCDICARDQNVSKATSMDKDVFKEECMAEILPFVSDLENRITPLKLLDAWTKNYRKRRKEVAEKIILDLIFDGYLREDYHFTPYNIVVYLVPTQKGFGDVGYEGPSEKKRKVVVIE